MLYEKKLNLVEFGFQHISAKCKKACSRCGKLGTGKWGGEGINKSEKYIAC